MKVRSSNEKAFDEIADTLAEMEWELGTNHRVEGEPELGELYVTRCTYDDRVSEISEQKKINLPVCFSLLPVHGKLKKLSF